MTQCGEEGGAYDETNDCNRCGTRCRSNWVHTGFAQSAPAAITASQLHGGGGWKTAGKAVLAQQHWHVDALRATDNTLRGRVTLGGSPLASAGNLVGQISGQHVSGNVVDDTGKEIVKFTGTITATGISGTYTDRTGETGNWSWDGPVPQ
jgi:hypothetical protein